MEVWNADWAWKGCNCTAIHSNHGIKRSLRIPSFIFPFKKHIQLLYENSTIIVRYWEEQSPTIKQSIIHLSIHPSISKTSHQYQHHRHAPPPTPSHHPPTLLPLNPNIRLSNRTQTLHQKWRSMSPHRRIMLWWIQVCARAWGEGKCGVLYWEWVFVAGLLSG